MSLQDRRQRTGKLFTNTPWVLLLRSAAGLAFWFKGGRSLGSLLNQRDGFKKRVVLLGRLIQLGESYRSCYSWGLQGPENHYDKPSFVRVECTFKPWVEVASRILCAHILLICSVNWRHNRKGFSRELIGSKDRRLQPLAEVSIWRQPSKSPCLIKPWFKVTSKTLLRYACNAASFGYGAVNDAVGARKFTKAPNLNSFAVWLVAPRLEKFWCLEIEMSWLNQD